MLLILDASVLISALVSSRESYTKNILKVAYQRKITFIVSNDTFAELSEALKVDKIKKRTTYKSAKIGAFIAWYTYNTRFVSIDKKTKSSITSRDIKDNIYLLLAEVSKADFLITLDKDLLVLKEVGRTQIVTPENFIKYYKNL